MVLWAGFEPAMFTSWVRGLQPRAFDRSATAARLARLIGFEPMSLLLRRQLPIPLGHRRVFIVIQDKLTAYTG